MLAEIERSAHLIALHLERTARELGVTQAEAHVLAQLARHGPLPVGELHRRFGHKRSTLTNVLDRLEKSGLVERTPNPRDRRSFLVRPTRGGTHAARKVARVLDALERDVRKRVADSDVAGVRAVAEALADSV